MLATVVSLNPSLATCSARTQNDVLVVFRPPPEAKIDLGDLLDVDLVALDRIQQIENRTKNKRIAAEVRSHDVHDLRFPPAHGTNRFPPLERRNG